MTLVTAGTASDFHLTDEQQSVVGSDASAIVVTASAGTGKTEILVRCVERFVNDPNNKNARVLVITYTTRAANEFQSRLHDRMGDLKQRITAETIHGFAHLILSTHGTHIGLPTDFQVITNNEDRAELLAGYDIQPPSIDYPELFRQLDLARATGEDHTHLKNWRDALDNTGVVDFNEMLTKATEVIRIPAIARMLRVIYGLVIVDEAQNLTKQQYQLITTLIGQHTETVGQHTSLIGQHTETGLPFIPTTLLGDPNQSVTRFAGGDSTLMKRFACDYKAQKFTLTQNFRSSKLLASLERAISNKLDDNKPHINVHTGHTTEGLKSKQPPITTDTHIDVHTGHTTEGVIIHRKFTDEQAEASFVAESVASLLNDGLPDEAVPPGERNRIQSEDIAVLGRHSATLNATSEALKELGHQVARAHNNDDLMATSVGVVALLLTRTHSERHRIAASNALRRELQLKLLNPDLNTISNKPRAISTAIAANAETGLADALRAQTDKHLNILVPLLEVDSPSEFVNVLEQCELPETAPDGMLADWLADQHLISETWSEFTSTTPIAERSWTRFALHFDRTQRARDLGPGIRLLTVHKAQGRQFEAVFVVGMNDGQFPDYRAMSKERKQAELKTFYVAVTRASRILVLTRACERPTSYGYRITEPSPYLQLARKTVTE